MKKETVKELYLGYACYTPFVIHGTMKLTLKTQISKEEAEQKVRNCEFNVEDFEENFEKNLANLPTSYKYMFSFTEYDAKDWAYNEAMYGE